MRVRFKWFLKFVHDKKNRPFLIALVVAVLNTEVAIPFILVGIFCLSGNSLSIAAGTWASTELCWWFWFSGWFYKEKIRRLTVISEAINIGQEAAKKFDVVEFLKPNKNDHYLLIKIKDLARKHSIENFDLDNYQDNPIFIAVKSVSYTLVCFLVFFLGLLPWFWIIGLMICQVIRWRLPLLLIFVANFLKNYYLAQFYEKIGLKHETTLKQHYYKDKDEWVYSMFF